MRIIAGEAKGRKILSPEGMNTRPTLDRIKESIFNIIQTRVYGSIAIDVFAGTGSLGLEAASRGAKECYLVDKHPVSFSLLKQNVENLKFQDRCTCLNMDSYEALKMLGKRGKKFDLMFIDPPYRKEMIPPAIDIIDQYHMLLKEGLIVCKIDTIEEIYPGDHRIVLKGHRRYGNTTVCFYAYKEEENE
ncbi:16S rRNA (guanine(966)-N(2))-methyltransferase RsmD [Haloimpatiens massiliensis]|uniref:16S rRNA (guanine(966)-N(2))-methyltransferase RsmD n=1 Tax=Haloimpatiens massiliensis TaxID=1658110 RepID=UPI000C859449|nr:16S rRNA (guanine(966)-N(2))-methyltransferase RsmD [Haloimpatiens massiliensis]